MYRIHANLCCKIIAESCIRLSCFPLKANSHIACRVHAAPLLCTDSAVSFVKVPVVVENIRTASPTDLTHTPPATEIGMHLIITVELRVVGGRNRTRAGRPHAAPRRPMLVHTCHAVPMARPCRPVPWP